MPFTVPPHLIEVTKEQFYGSVGKLNVHPRTLIETFREPALVSVWELLDWARQGRRVGVSTSEKGRHRYFVEPEFAKGGI